MPNKTPTDRLTCRWLLPSRAYRWALLEALPELPRTGERDEALDFLARLAD